MKCNPNEPAFPEAQVVPQYNRHTYGLTKLEYVATAVMAKIVVEGYNPKITAANAVVYAKALINELNKEAAT